MKFLIIHNRYSRAGGEERVVAFQHELLRAKGHTVLCYEHGHGELSKAGRFFSALGNRKAVAEVRELVERERPDVAIVHNLFPIISPAILPELKRQGVRVLMTLHNYRLICPTGLFYTRESLCERCGGSPLREWNCLLHRCEGSWPGSAAFALRNYWARRRKYYLRHVDSFLALTDFQQQKLEQYGLQGQRFRVIPNVIDPVQMPAPSGIKAPPYVAYAGRISPEKGIDLLLEAARKLPHIPFKVAGALAEGISLDKKPDNLEWVGLFNWTQLADFYANARMVVSASRCYEGFPLSVLEAMYYARPVVAPDLAAFPEIVDKGGLLYPPGDAEGLARAIEKLWNDGFLAAEIGRIGHRQVTSRYTPERYYEALIEQALQTGEQA